MSDIQTLINEVKAGMARVRKVSTTFKRFERDFSSIRTNSLGTKNKIVLEVCPYRRTPM